MAIQQPAPAPDPVRQTPSTQEGGYNFRAAAVVGFLVGVVDIFVAARFLGKLFGASSQSAVVNFIYQVSSPMVAPFKGIFGNGGLSTNNLPTASLAAVLPSACIHWGVFALFRVSPSASAV